MDLRQLQALTAVADHGTFSAAAEALATVQSNVSAHIARLERELGATLVDRGAGRLTEEGLAVVERARRIEAELTALASDVASLRHEVTGRVRAGIIGTTARWLVPRLLDLMGSRHPGVHMEIVDATSTSLGPQLVNGRLDLAVINMPLPDRELMSEPLFAEDLVLFVPAASSLAKAKHVVLQDLVGVPLLLPPLGTAFRDLLEVTAAAQGVVLTPRAELDGLRLIASLAIAGQGTAILPASAVPAVFQVETKAVLVRDVPRREVGVAHRRRGMPSAAAKALHAAVREAVAAEAKTNGYLHLPAA